MTPFALLVACQPFDNDTPGDDTSESDADTDADTDGDVETDADSDSDTDADTPSTGDTSGASCTPSTVFPTDDGAADFVLEGTPLSAAGRAVLLEDVDGDGIDDLFVGGPEYFLTGPEVGRVWLIYGPLGASGTLDVVADAWFDGEGSGAHTGQQLGRLGDANGDGLPDVAALAENYDNDSGRLSLELGDPVRHSGALTMAAWDRSVTGNGYDYLGQGATGVGDLDHDGFADVAFAALHYGNSEGRVYLLPGQAVWPAGDLDDTRLPFIDGQIDDELCGTGRCIAADDFDGDGNGDIAIATDGSWYGRVYLRYGDGLQPDAESTGDFPWVETSQTGGGFGSSTAAPGDIDGDGYADLVVADPSNEQAAAFGGRAWIFRGGSARWTGTTAIETAAWLTIEGVETGGALGRAVTGVGDVDCDGRADIAVSAPGATGLQSASGVVGMWLGPSGGTQRLSDATAVIRGGIGGQLFGWSLAHGDIDGNGESDLVVGAGNYGSETGRVYVFLDAF